MQITSTLRLLVIGGLMLSYKSAKEPAIETKTPVFKDKAGTELIRLRDHAHELRELSDKGRHNQKIFFLIDMSIPSGKKRFFVYNSVKDSIELSGLVTHGSGQGTGVIDFSNSVGSNCTSLGKYEIGNSYHGRFGLAYKLYGLEKTNDKAFERFVVLHSFSCVPDYEVAPDNICMSWGCPTVSPSFLNKLKGYIEHSDLPILLDIYY
jgi:hypothetical protein